MLLNFNRQTHHMIYSKGFMNFIKPASNPSSNFPMKSLAKPPHYHKLSLNLQDPSASTLKEFGINSTCEALMRLFLLKQCSFHVFLSFFSKSFHHNVHPQYTQKRSIRKNEKETEMCIFQKKQFQSICRARLCQMRDRV